ncbi:TonB-dependent receptor [Bergeyella porcorum]
MKRYICLIGLLSAMSYAQDTKENLKTKDIEGVTLSKAQAIKAEIEREGYAVNVVETKELALRNLQTNEILDRTAGLRIRQDGGLGSRINFNLNGMTGNAVRVFIDGVPASNFGRSFSLRSIPPALIERIEVYKGVVPGHLSEDSLGGAINIILKKQNKDLVNTSYSFGSFNTHQVNVNASHRTDKGLFVDISGFYNYSDNSYEVWGDQITHIDYLGKLTRGHKEKRFNDAFRSYGSKIEVGYTGVKWADRFAIGGVFSDDYKEIQHGVTMQRVFGDRHSRRNANMATLSYRKNHLFTRGLSLKLDANYSHQKNQAIDSVGIMYDWRGPILYPDGTPVRYSSGAELGNRKTAEINTNKSIAVRANLGYQITENNALYVNYLFNNYERGISDEFLPLAQQMLQNTRDLQKNIATVTFENLAFSRRLRTNVFYKYYQQKVTSNEPYLLTATPSPQYDVRSTSKVEKYNGFGGTLSYALTSKLYLMTSAERAIRFPDENEIFGNVASLVNPANGLRPEESFNANLGVNLTNLDFGKHNLKANVSVFYRDTKGMIRQAETPGNTGTTYYENLEDVLTKGIDAEISYTYNNRLNLMLTASKFDVLFNTEYNSKGERYLYYRQQIRNEPSFKFNVGLSYYLNDVLMKDAKASFHYNVHYINEFKRNWSNVGLTNLEIIPRQFSNDVGFVFTFPKRKVTIGVDAKNIFNQQLFDNFGLQKPGRAFYGKITYNIL